MTVPNTPPDAGLLPPAPQQPSRLQRGLRELWTAAPIGLVCLLLGVVMGLLWLWWAPEVPLVVHGQSVLYVDPEGEQRAAADGTFLLLGVGFGLLTAGGAFVATRQRGGGIAVAVLLAVGGLFGSLIAWKLGAALGPTTNLVGHAKQVGDGHTFYEALDLGAKGALLAWPMTAMVVLLGLSAALGKREEDPPPYWAGTPWALAGEDGHEHAHEHDEVERGGVWGVPGASGVADGPAAPDLPPLPGASAPPVDAAPAPAAPVAPRPEAPVDRTPEQRPGEDERAAEQHPADRRPGGSVSAG
ncbi:hypothetical protein GCM10009665_13510 [Kitasatospora nipponensis]|uniref:ABC transporter permease n=1 Tax=Kitasatospora nipponensis TaxID=258049 RepID=A0ABP4GGQ5_9ACTN